ncbi:MAG: geranylgeranyl reductase family protein [Nitrospiraceae bacterium]|nr:geranylgeranyl reductase family protein [Nitrospiraceae bacterium]
MRLETKVLIVGGGPAGATAGRVLAAAGVDCIILEKNPQGAKPCGGGIPFGAFEVFQLPLSVIKRRVNVIRVSPPKSSPFEIRFENGYIGMVERREFDSVLRDMARAEGAAVMKGAFVKIRECGKTAVLSEAEIEGQTMEVRSEYLLAADGVNSRVRSSLGMKHINSLYTLGVKLPLDGNPFRGNCCEFYFDASARGGYSWIFPGASNVSAGTGSTNPKKLKAGLQRLLLQKGFPPDFQTNSLRGYRIPLWEQQPLVRGNVLFAGDSASHVMPFTFEGIYYAMRAAQFAAEALIQGNPGLYRKLWRQRFRARFLLMKTLWTAFLRNERGMETLLSAFRDERVQQRGIRLWLDKTEGRGSFVSFVNALRKYVLF